MHLTHLKIQNLRALSTADLALNTPATGHLKYPNVNVLLGDNGLGKTSVLRAAALAALGPLLSGSSGYVPDSLIRVSPGRKSASKCAGVSGTSVEVGIDLAAAEHKTGPGERLPDHVTLTTSVQALGTTERLRWQCAPESAASAVEAIQYDDQSRSLFMVGYGATRRVELSSQVDQSARLKARLSRYARVSSLFEEQFALIPLSFWLPAYAKRNKGRYVQVVHLMNDLLPPACRMQETATVTANGTEHLFTMNGITVPFRSLSDGYRAYVGWIGDMLYHVCMGAGSGVKLRNMHGVVLIDEVDLHLHPEWQRVVVPTLATTLPNVQFIVTTHSPLVVGSLESGNIFLLEEENNATVIRRLPEQVHGRSAEQILLSPYFGLDSTRAPDVSEALRSLANRASEGDQAAPAAYLKLLSGGLAEKDVRALTARPVAAKQGTRRAGKRSSDSVKTKK